MTRFAGRRRDDTPHGDLPPLLEPGDYWKVLIRDGSRPRHVDHDSNLTGEHWEVVVPLGGGYGIANLELHTVREHDDGTISVAPGDGSSNSILVQKGQNGPQWHGFIDHGEFWTTE